MAIVRTFECKGKTFQVDVQTGVTERGMETVVRVLRDGQPLPLIYRVEVGTQYEMKHILGIDGVSDPEDGLIAAAESDIRRFLGS